MIDLTLLQQLDAITDDLAALRERADATNDADAMIAIGEMFVAIGECWVRILRAEGDTAETAAMESQFGPQGDA